MYYINLLIFNMKYNWLFIFILFISPIFVISTNSWFTMWINMELNLMVFIMFLMLNNIFIYDLCMKYFLINAFSSMLFILMSNILLFSYNNYIYLLIINMSMMLKLGLVPFHFWFIDLMSNLNWMSCFFLSTWQKIIPFFIMFNIYIQNFIIIFIFFSGMFSMIFCMNQMYMKKIYGYSSINHMCWMMMSMFLSELVWLIYFFIYTMINLFLMLILKIFNINYFMDLYYKFDNKKLNTLFMFIMFSLGGLPPFLGFFMKWYMIFYLVESNNFFILLLLILFSLIFLFYYLRLMYMNMFNNYMNFNMIKYYNMNYSYLMIYLFLCLLMLMSIFMMFIYI